MSKFRAIISMRAETHIHVGVGQSSGAIDLPVAREKANDYPYIPGSGVKGAFRVWSKEAAKDLKTESLFGRADGNDDDGSAGHAGNLICSDARLLLLPVRCLSDDFKWVVCPAVLRRLIADSARAGHKISFSLPRVEAGTFFGLTGTSDNVLGLEEREFTRAGDIDSAIKTALANFVESDGLEQKLVILSDRDFIWFARYGLPVAARNVLDENKKSENLWYEETMSPDTFLYLTLGERTKGQVEALITAINVHSYIQMGGNETIGQGWFKLGVIGGAS